jgi:hypothetical protein
MATKNQLHQQNYACAPLNLIDKRPSATELIEAELMNVGSLPKDIISELDEREKQKRRYKSSQIF